MIAIKLICWFALLNTSQTHPGGCTEFTDRFGGNSELKGGVSVSGYPAYAVKYLHNYIYKERLE